MLASLNKSTTIIFEFNSRHTLHIASFVSLDQKINKNGVDLFKMLISSVLVNSAKLGGHFRFLKTVMVALLISYKNLYLNTTELG